MTNKEAVAIIHKEYLCVDRDCDIERSCGKCDLMIPSKEPILEAYKMAIQALEQEPCEDAISRQAVLDMWRQIICYDRTCHYRDEGRCTETFCDFKLFEYEINHMPTVKPKEPTGHWIEEDMFDGDVAYRCSECNELFWIESGTPKDNGYNFCPKCGKRLVDEQERSEKE